MVALAHVFATLCYLGAAALAAAPFVRAVRAPVVAVTRLLGLATGVHVAAIGGLMQSTPAAPLSGIGPALSLAGLLIGVGVLVAELLAREVTLALAAAPLAAVATTASVLLGADAGGELIPQAGRALLASHIVLGFVGFAAFAMAGAAGFMYLLERHELKSRRFTTVFRAFPALETLDRVNHIASVAAFIGLTLGISLALAYAVAYRAIPVAELVWGTATWVGVAALALGRTLGRWQAYRAALLSSVSFSVIVVLYLALRLASPGGSQFL